MKILVTGGSGFMGSNFIRHMIHKYSEYKILNYDVLNYAGLGNNLEDLESNPNYTFIKGDIRDYNLLLENMNGVDVLVNYAAQTHVDNSIIDPLSAVSTNVIGTNNILEVIRKRPVDRFIQISTDEVFGSAEHKPFEEEDPFRPNSPYSAAKAGADLLCRAYITTFNSPVIVTHSCNNIGPYQHPEKLVPLFVTNLIQNKKIPVYGHGLNLREWIYVTDHAEAIDTILHKGKLGETYNIGTGCLRTNLEITNEILNFMGKDENMIEYVNDRLGHDFCYSINSSKLRNELNWRPKNDFNSMLKKTLEWYLKNKTWWKNLKKYE